MAISSRFSVAAHILTLIHQNEGNRITSEYIASSVNTNPVVIRRILGMLSKAGLVRTNAGVAGATLVRPLSEITMLDVYRAVLPDQEELFSMHEHPNPACPVGRNIQSSLDHVFVSAQRALEAELDRVTMEQVSLEVAGKA
ncbi:Rrf2 family transcriptional regulator [Cohnella sp. AR92]|uniref:Rrf2 family transcriptional regulator n=1 Tax=Cohnella sp. AR92 TaxID=648716 RepID=UPI000F8C8A6D|nr:Rrf2 family transcriptional regulator [Cohnella sp. AR92]RUS49099.1 transcriptional regulator [Cohnella sp. AR92]